MNFSCIFFRSRSRSPTTKSASNTSSSIVKPAILREEPINSKETGNKEPTPEKDEAQLPAAKVRMTLKPSAVSKSMNKSVLEKLGNNDSTTPNKLAPLATEQMLENAKAKREENKLKKASEIKKAGLNIFKIFSELFLWNIQVFKKIFSSLLKHCTHCHLEYEPAQFINS